MELYLFATFFRQPLTFGEVLHVVYTALVKEFIFFPSSFK